MTMRQVTGSMAGVVKGMEGAMKAMDVEKVCEILKGPGPGTSCLIPLSLMSQPAWLISIQLTFFQISAVMDKFESQFEDLDVATGYYETATSSATAVGTPQDEVDRLIHLVADEAGIELKEEMKSPEQAALTKDNVDEEEREGALGERLRALRN